MQDLYSVESNSLRNRKRQSALNIKNSEKTSSILIEDEDEKESKESLELVPLNPVPSNDLKAKVTAAYENHPDDTDLMKRTAKEIKYYLGTISTNVFSKEDLRKELIEYLDDALKKARSAKYDDPLIDAYEYIINRLIAASPTFQHKILSSDLLRIARWVQIDIAKEEIKPRTKQDFNMELFKKELEKREKELEK